MLNLNEREISNVRYKFRSAIVDLNNRCLKQSAKWVCEQLVGMKDEDDEFEAEVVDNIEEFKENISANENDVIMLAHSLINNGEYQRYDYWYILITVFRPKSSHVLNHQSGSCASQQI